MNATFLEFFIDNWWRLTWRITIIVSLLTFIICYITRICKYNVFKANKDGIEVKYGEDKEHHYKEWYYGPLPYFKQVCGATDVELAQLENYFYEAIERKRFIPFASRVLSVKQLRKLFHKVRP